MKIKRKFRFEAAHRLKDHLGRCNKLHGHSYHGEITISGAVSDDGMIMDFSRLYSIVQSVLPDHRTLLQTGDPLVGILGDHAVVVEMDGPPTAENIATMIAAKAQSCLDDGYTVVTVELWETSDSCAVWTL